MSRQKVESQWTIDEFHRPFTVHCSTAETENKYHYVFNLPSEYMRRHATTFEHFRSTYDAKQMEICFHFFLDFAEAMLSESKSKQETIPKGQRSVAFVEWCSTSESKTELTTCGWRFHVFVDREVNEMRVLELLLGKFARESTKLVGRGKSVPAHYRIMSMALYASKVCKPYTGELGNVEQLWQGLTEGCALAPSQIFEMKEMPGSMHSVDDYLNETNEFVFPSHNFFRLDTEILSWKLHHRYLPDHVMFSYAKPEVRVSRDPFVAEFMPHRYYKNVSVENERELAEFMDENEESYIVTEASATYRNMFQIGEVNYPKITCVGGVWIDTADVEDMTGAASAMYEKMKNDQHDLSTIDHITLGAFENPDPDTYVEQEFITHVWDDPDCFASKPLKAIIRWFKKEYDPSLIRPFPLVHEHMSVFAHRACIVMNMYHHLYQVSSAHRSCYWIHIARLDAFRHEHNLHLNCASTGDAATSKSFMFTLMEMNSIGGTVSSRTYDTDKADAIDSDVDHFVSVFDEAPPAFFKDPKKKGPLEAMKMRLTSMKTSHRRLWTNDETGVREQIESVSSNIGCLMGATNEARTSFDPALVTRFHFFEAERALNTKHSVSNCQHAAETMAPAQKEKLKAAIMFHQFEQGYVALVWQYVRMGRLLPPNKTAVGILLRKFKEILKADHGVTIPDRTGERIKRLSQNLAIVRAKQILYHTQTGKYANVPFHPSQIPDAEPYMICTEEIVMHAIGLEFDTIVSRNRRKVLEKVWLMHKECENYKQDDKGDDDVNYIQIPGNIRSISKRLLNALMEDDIHVSSCNIQTVFEEIKDQTLSSFGYTNDSDTFHDGMPGYDNEQKRWSAYEEFGGNIYLHLDLFKDLRVSTSEKNIYKLTLEKMMHKHSALKKIVLGTTSFESKRPNEWDTLVIKPDTSVVVEMSHGIGRQDDIYGILGATEDMEETLEHDIDVYVTNDHAKNCGYEQYFYQPDNQDWSERVIEYPYRANKRKRS